MDKAAVIARVASDPADRLLLARVLDQYEKAERRGIPAATVFLSPREQAMAQALLNTLGVRSGYVFDGGYEGAERKLLAFLPDWAEDAAGELAFFRAAFRDIFLPAQMHRTCASVSGSAEYLHIVDEIAFSHWKFLYSS